VYLAHTYILEHQHILIYHFSTILVHKHELINTTYTLLPFFQASYAYIHASVSIYFPLVCLSTYPFCYHGITIISIFHLHVLHGHLIDYVQAMLLTRQIFIHITARYTLTIVICVYMHTITVYKIHKLIFQHTCA
jgi:hypothetical protein